jgi:hypothetical protein
MMDLSDAGTLLPVTILLDADDDYRVTRSVLGLQDRAGGVLVVDPTVGTTAVMSLARDILVALGQQPAAVVSSRLGTAAMWQAATAWLSAAGIGRLVVLRAHRLPQRALARLTQLAADASVALTVVWHAPPPPSWEGCGRHTPETGRGKVGVGPDLGNCLGCEEARSCH